MPFVEVESNVKVFAQDWGSGKPIVFIHGFPFSHRIFEYHMTMLAEAGYRTVGIDLRGFGQLDKPWHGCDYDTWTSDIVIVFTIPLCRLQQAKLNSSSSKAQPCCNLRKALMASSLRRKTDWFRNW